MALAATNEMATMNGGVGHWHWVQSAKGKEKGRERNRRGWRPLEIRVAASAAIRTEVAASKNENKLGQLQCNGNASGGIA